MRMLLRNLGVSFMAAIPVGIIVGILLRAFMFLIARRYQHLASGFHWEAMLLIAAVGVGHTLACALVYTLVRNRLPKSLPLQAAAFGFADMVLFGGPFLLSNPSGELFGPQAALGIPLFASLFVIQGALLVSFAAAIGKWTEAKRAKRNRIAFAVGIVMAIPALVALGGIVSEIVTETIPEIRNMW